MQKIIEYEYKSALAPYIKGLVDEKRSMGHKYNNEAKTLRRFDEFWSKHNGDLAVITPDSIRLWFTAQSPKEGPSMMQAKVTSVRQLCIYMCAIGVQDYIPDMTVRRPKPTYHVLDTDEIKALFLEVDTYLPRKQNVANRRIAVEYRVLLRLILSTGMRNSECCDIKREQVDFENRRISICQAKGNKNRFVYFKEDVAKMLQDYLKFLDNQASSSEWLFPGSNLESPVTSAALEGFFMKCWKRTSFAEKCEKNPTVHSLRHTYVVICINKWVKEGKNLDEMIEYLSKQLGHKGREETYHYYHEVMEALKIASQKSSDEYNVFPNVRY